MVTLVDELGLKEVGCDRNMGNLLYALAAGISSSGIVHRLYIGKYIKDMKIKNSVQLTAALNYVKNLPMGDPVNTSLK